MMPEVSKPKSKLQWVKWYDWMLLPEYSPIYENYHHIKEDLEFFREIPIERKEFLNVVKMAMISVGEMRVCEVELRNFFHKFKEIDDLSLVDLKNRVKAAKVAVSSLENITRYFEAKLECINLEKVELEDAMKQELDLRLQQLRDLERDIRHPEWKTHVELKTKGDYEEFEFYRSPELCDKIEDLKSNFILQEYREEGLKRQISNHEKKMERVGEILCAQCSRKMNKFYPSSLLKIFYEPIGLKFKGNE